jgi:2-dehydropantoate 2-reductase
VIRPVVGPHTGVLSVQNGVTSLHHDLIHGRRIEVESLQGHAVRLGERHGIPTPMLFAVYALLRPHRDGSG